MAFKVTKGAAGAAESPEALYTQVATDLLREVISPLERLPTT